MTFKRFLFLLPVTFLVVFLSGCGGGTTGSADSNTIKLLGQVLDSQQRALRGIRVTLLSDGESTETDGDGLFALDAHADQAMVGLLLEAEKLSTTVVLEAVDESTEAIELVVEVDAVKQRAAVTSRSDRPRRKPTRVPTAVPTRLPPVAEPTPEPPTVIPDTPTSIPTETPTVAPTFTPTAVPTIVIKSRVDGIVSFPGVSRKVIRSLLISVNGADFRKIKPKGNFIDSFEVGADVLQIEFMLEKLTATVKIDNVPDYPVRAKIRVRLQLENTNGDLDGEVREELRAKVLKVGFNKAKP